MALLHFKEAYHEAGLTIDEAELPDHLAVVLEFAATGDAELGNALLAEHRGVIALLHDALSAVDSPYVHVVEAVLSTTSALTPEDEILMQRLARLRTTDRDSGHGWAGRSHPGAVRRRFLRCRDGGPSMTTTQILLWDVLPYVTIAVFVVGMIWRFRYDKFGWTTRSSQLYERSLAADRQSPLPPRHARRRRRPRHRSDDPGVVDRGGRCQRGPLPPQRRCARGCGGGRHPGRRRHARLPTTHHRPGLRRHDQERQDDVHLPGGGDLPRAGRHDDGSWCPR